MSEVDTSAPKVDTTADNPGVESVEVNNDVVVDAGETEEVVTQSWLDSLDANYRNDPKIQGYKSPNELAKAYKSLESLVGKEKIVIPAENASNEEKAAFWNKIGRPEEAAKYETPNLEVPEEIRMKEHTLEAFKAKAHELGLTKKQFADLYGWYTETTLGEFNNQLESTKKMANETEKTLRQEWGNAYETKVQNAQGLINTFFKGKELHPAFKVLANDKGFVQAMSEVAERLGEDVIQGTPRTVKTPAEATQELNAIIGDSKHPYFDELHPEHDAAVDKVLALQAAASAV